MTTGSKLADLFIESIKWNEECLPENTLEMQLKKVEEEILEGKEKADSGVIAKDEIADVFIATAGIARFDKDIAMHMIWHAISNLPITLEELVEEVEKKLQILRERTYTIVNGVYRHETLQ